MDDATKNRLRLALKSERALGLATAGPADWSRLPAVPVAPLANSQLASRSVTSAPIVARPAPPRVVQESQSARPVAPTAPAPAIETPPTSEPFSSPILSVDDRRLQLAAMDENEVRGCQQCGMCRTRKNTVFGEGAPDARLMFIGEGPGNVEDQTGRPFVGPAGALLDKMIVAMGLKREQVYIANIVKCRAYLPGPPAKDRAPAAEETAACSPYLVRQVEIIRPQAIVTLGVPASQFVLSTKLSMSRLRGNWHTWHGIAVMPTWHPSYLMRCEKDGNVEPKRQAWSDLQKVMIHLGLTAPKRGT